MAHLVDFRAVTPPHRRPWWPAALLALLGLLALYERPLRTGFLNDDYLFLEQARTRPLLESLTSLGALGNYYRPVSRQLYFAALTPLAGDSPALFHTVNMALFLAALVLLADLLVAIAGPTGVLIGLAYVALLPFQRVNLTWVSCSQDLLALGFTLAALAAFRRRLDPLAAVLYLLATFSKESALPLPLALLAWSLWVERERAQLALRRLAPCAAATLVWVAATLLMRAQNPFARAPLTWDLAHFAAGLVHGAQSMLGLEAPGGLSDALAVLPYAPLALALLTGAGLWMLWPARAAAPAASAATPGVVAATRTAGATGSLTLDPGAVRRFGLVWVVVFALVTGPVVGTWSGYYYTLTAVGAAVLLATVASRVSALAWMAAITIAVSWHGIASESRRFAIAEDPWGWTSHLTSAYFQRGAALTDSLSAQLLRLEPKPAPHTRFFFATLPPWAGFQMGNGALIRARYHDPTLESFFYSQFSESTAAWRPVRGDYWDGQTLAPLYGQAHDPFFQIGSDLLLFDRPAGAVHAFRRGLSTGEQRFDLLYGLGWAELWRGDRGAAEHAWTLAGMRDDSTAWFDHMVLARQALFEFHDSLATRRALIEAIMTGVGRPDAHAVLGELLMRERPKYGLLELKVAAWLKPTDWVARRGLVMGLVDQRLDDAARAELAALERIEPDFQSDTLLAPARRILDARSRSTLKVVTY